MTTLHLRKSIGLLIPLAFVCFALAPKVKAYNTFYDDIHVAASTPFQPGGATHETRADSQTALQFPNESEVAPEIETVPSAPPTRSSFMATWDNVTGATGYLLDVSMSSSFSSYAEGYHELDVGNVKGRVVTGLNPGTTYYYRVRPYDATGPGSYSEATEATTVATTGLTIHATFDSSITGNPNAAAIEAMINRAISIYESLFRDPITIQIRFRYSTTLPNGDPIPAGSIALSNYVLYPIPWNTYINALRADAKTGNDNLANASLPGSALTPNLKPSSADGRAVGLDTPPAMFANGNVGNGGPYDGIVTLNAAAPYQFSRPPSSSNFDAQRSTEHEIDEVMGLGSRINFGTDLRPQDLFSWSSAGVRNISSSGTRFFSINGGVTNLVNFNQNSPYDFGDWRSTACPQAHPYVQNAFVCHGQDSDVTATSREGINLDVIGYDLVNPIVTTNAASNVTSSSATLNGTVNPNGVITTVHFEYGITTNYGSTTANRSYTGNTTQSVSANITGLSPNTTYHFRLVGTSNGETSYGNDRTFSTFSATGLPVVATSAATNVANFSATLNGSVYPHGLTTNVYFQYGTTTSYGLTTAPQIRAGNAYFNISANISGLSANTVYHFRIVATNGDGSSFGADRTFTATGPPVVTTNPATLVASYSATLNGSVNPNGSTTTVYFQYGLTSSYGSTTASQIQTGNYVPSVSATISGLSASTTYHFRIVAQNNSGTRYGNDAIFTTLSATGLAVATTYPATLIASFSATLNGSLDPHGSTTTVYFQYGTSISYGSMTASHGQAGNAFLDINANITGLNASTTYHFRIVASNSAGAAYGGDRTFTTPSATGPPIVATSPATLIASFAARLNGSVDPHGLTSMVYFQYGPTASYGSTTASQSQSGNTFRNINAGISGLSASTTYHFRIVATNSAGTGYSSGTTFTTLSATGAPIVTTNPATNIGSSSAMLNGTVDPHGLTTTVYYQYGTTTSYGSTTASQTTTGNTYHSVSANATGLTAGTVYHFRIVATNSDSTRNGIDMTFAAVPSDNSVTWQNNAVHDGFDPASHLVTPLSLKWSRDFSTNGVTSISYPLIAQGLVFVTSAGPRGQSKTLRALNEHTGMTVWSANISGTYGFVNAAYDSGKVFVVNYDGLMKAFNAATGTLLWSVSLPGQTAFTSPPTAANGIVFTGGAGIGGTVYAVDEANGAVLWTNMFGGDHSSPAVTLGSGFVSYSCPQASAFNTTTGQQLWHYSGGCSGGGGKTPVVHAAQVYVRDSFFTRTNGLVLNADTGTLIRGFNSDRPPAFFGNVALFLQSGTLRGVNALNGQVLWSFAGDGMLSSAPVVVNQTIYIGSNSGTLYGLNASGHQIWSTQVGAAIPAPNERDAVLTTGLGAGDSLLVVPTASVLYAYGN